MIASTDDKYCSKIRVQNMHLSSGKQGLRNTKLKVTRAVYAGISSCKCLLLGHFQRDSVHFIANYLLNVYSELMQVSSNS